MIRICHGFWHRNSIRALFLAASFLAVQVTAQAANLNGWRTAGIENAGAKSFSVNPSAGDLRIPMKNPGGGWQTAGNYGVQNGATGQTFRLGGEGQVFRSMPDGTTVYYPLQYRGDIPLSAIVAGAAAFLGGPLGVACSIGCPALVDWLGDKFRMPKDGEKTLMQRNPEVCTSGTCYEYSHKYAGPYQKTATQACNAAIPDQAAQYPTQEFKFHGIIGTDPSEMICALGQFWKDAAPGQHQAGEPNGTLNIQLSSRTRAPDAPATGKEWIPASMDDIAPYMSARPTPSVNVIPEILNKGGEIDLPKTGTVTGPSSIQGPQTTKTSSDGSRTVERTTYNFSTSGNTVNNTTNVTTTTVYNTDNTVRSTTTSSTAPTNNTGDKPKEEEKDPCEANPKRLGCSELDEPTGEIPKDTKNITFTPQDGPGGTGQCPADLSMSFRAAPGIGAAKIVDWTSFCGMALPLRAIVMALASIMAFFIVMPGGKVE